MKRENKLVMLLDTSMRNRMIFERIDSEYVDKTKSIVSMLRIE